MKQMRNYGEVIKHDYVGVPSDDYPFTEEIVCRGGTVNNFRKQLWHNYKASILSGDKLNYQINNSYMLFAHEPENRYDPNAIAIMCHGEFYGTMGYVGREYIPTVNNILRKCTKYRIDVINADEIGEKEVLLKISWTETK